MKKTRLLIATLVCAVMLMGIGYAWWNDSVVIGGTAATGNMDVVLQNPTATFAEPAGAKATLSEDEKTITCTFTNLYPGAVGTFSTGIVNNSSIPVKFAGAEVTFSQDAEALNNHLLASWDGIEYLAIDQFLAGISNFEGSTMAVDEVVNKTVYLKLDEKALNDSTENKTIGVNVKFNWQQFNYYPPEV
jgi:predicted ribosomally synthesized peptide with SipW-like signal peptide